jgi:acyl carrier protein
VTLTIFDQVRAIAADVLLVSPETVAPDTSPQTVENWDSVQHLNLVLALEEKFGIQFAPEEMERMQTVGQIAELVAEKTRGTA